MLVSLYFNVDDSCLIPDVTRNWKRSSEISQRKHPDSHIPMSVISERYQDQIYTPVLPEDELCRFGEVYESNLLHVSTDLCLVLTKYVCTGDCPFKV